MRHLDDEDYCPPQWQSEQSLPIRSSFLGRLLDETSHDSGLSGRRVRLDQPGSPEIA
jgi:hypothetical protein